MENPALRDVILIFMMDSGLVVILSLLLQRTKPLRIAVREVCRKVFRLGVLRLQDDWMMIMKIFPLKFLVFVMKLTHRHMI